MKECKQKVVVGPNFLAHWFIYDFEICADYEELKATMESINHHGYDLISVTQDHPPALGPMFRIWQKDGNLMYLLEHGSLVKNSPPKSVGESWHLSLPGS